MSTRDDLHRLVDELDETVLDAARRLAVCSGRGDLARRSDEILREIAICW